ncbi:1684_t:CDS:1, partial [Racocetra fulgida]
NNLAGDMKRAVGCALLVASGNIGGMISSHLYRSQDAPDYKFGNAISILCLFIAIALSIILYYLLYGINTLKVMNPERFLKGKNEEEALLLGDNHPSFIYSL